MQTHIMQQEAIKRMSVKGGIKKMNKSWWFLKKKTKVAAHAVLDHTQKLSNEIMYKV